MQKFVVKYQDENETEHTAYVKAETMIEVTEAYENKGYTVTHIHVKEG